jgi:hypothetical protein
LYGTIYAGGVNGDGTLFSLAFGLGAFVKTLPHSSRTGGIIGILGTDLTGTIAVAFNGTPAAFTIDSPTLIAATVPAERRPVISR